MPHVAPRWAWDKSPPTVTDDYGQPMSQDPSTGDWVDSQGQHWTENQGTWTQAKGPSPTDTAMRQYAADLMSGKYLTSAQDRYNAAAPGIQQQWSEQAGAQAADIASRGVSRGGGQTQANAADVAGNNRQLAALRMQSKQGEQSDRMSQLKEAYRAASQAGDQEQQAKLLQMMDNETKASGQLADLGYVTSAVGAVGSMARGGDTSGGNPPGGS